MLFKKIDKVRQNSIMLIILLMIVGHFFMLMPHEYLFVLNGILVFILDVYMLLAVLNFLGSPKVLINYINLLLGMILGFFATIFMIYGDFMIMMLIWSSRIIPILLGLYGIFHSAVFAKRSGKRGWRMLIILSFLLIGLGLFSFFNPFEGEQARIQVMGGVLMVSAYICLLELNWMWPLQKEEI